MDRLFEKYFLAANSCEGFVSYFEESYKKGEGYRALIIKGGPGTGKSSFMKRIAAMASDKGFNPVLCYCSSDPGSLDGVIIPEKKTVILDGTAPHVVEPEFPGATEEIINLGQFWDTGKLRDKERQIIEVSRHNRECHRSASRYLSAAGKLLADNLNISRGFVNTEYTEDFAAGLCRRHIPAATVVNGREDIRFIEGITPEGIVFYNDTVDSFYAGKVIVGDKYGGASDIIMNAVRRYALAAGYSIITLKNPFLPSDLCDHILIPELSLAFVTENAHAIFDTDARRIRAKRFYDFEAMSEFSERLVFNERVAGELLSGAVKMLSDAKSLHDDLEKFYIGAMDFEKITALADETAAKILS